MQALKKKIIPLDKALRIPSALSPLSRTRARYEKIEVKVQQQKLSKMHPKAIRQIATKKAKAPLITSTVGKGTGFSRLKEIPLKLREAHKNTLKIDTFEALKITPGIRDSIKASLNHLETVKPTPIQVLATKTLRRRSEEHKQRRELLFASDTGTGKTLAYLAPLLSDLHEQRQSETWQERPKIRSVILVPTSDLVTQVRRVIEGLKIEDLNVFAYEYNVMPKQAQRALSSRIDIFVSTPEKVLKAVHHDMPDCISIVCDEADTLMDDSFRKATIAVIDKAPHLWDLVFFSATIPRVFLKKVRSIYPNLMTIMTPNIHKLPPRADFKVVEVSKPPFRGNKLLALKQALYGIHHDGTEPGSLKRVIVFVNSGDNVSNLVKELKDDGYPAFGVSGKVAPEERAKFIDSFINEAPPAVDEGINVQVLVATDIMARGVDMNSIRNVILYDMPFSSVDLLHRAGRTGRLGRRGRILLLVDRSEAKDWVKGLRKVAMRHLALS